MAGLKPILINFLLIGLFAFCLISGGIMLGIQNNAANNIGDDAALSAYKDSLETTLGDAQPNNNLSITALGDSPVSTSGAQTGFTLDAIAGIWKTLKVVPMTIYNLTFGIANEKIFGSGFGIVKVTISAILLLILIFGIIKLIVQGQDE